MRSLVTRCFAAVALAATILLPGAAAAGSVNVAVAANFTEPAKEIAARFKASSGHDAVLSFGASGQFYTQIREGAPFQVLLSADDERPKKLVEDRLALADSRFTYAIGKLVLWSRDASLVKGEETLKGAGFAKLAIANPVAAPYGAAAVETLKALGLYDTLQPKIVTGNTIGQAFQFVDTGNAELGFVALSQVINQAGSRWSVPQRLYTEIRQDAVLLKIGAGQEAATAFLAFLKGPEARAIIEKFGYALDGRSGS
jgi:molybdate transport system substrate-binding protein